MATVVEIPLVSAESEVVGAHILRQCQQEQVVGLCDTPGGDY